ncbi:MAG: tripartite tricarboxylate transporter TctB family protein [bacterium]
MRRAEIVAAALLVLFALAMVRQASKLAIGWTDIGPGSGFMPFWLSVGVAAAGAVILTQSMRAPRTGEDEPFIPSRSWKPLLIMFLPMVAVIALLDWLGIYIGGGLYLAGYTRLVGRFRWVTVAVISVVVPFVLFLIFEKWFLMPLPKGTILETLLYGR